MKKTSRSTAGLATDGLIAEQATIVGVCYLKRYGVEVIGLIPKSFAAPTPDL